MPLGRLPLIRNRRPRSFGGACAASGAVIASTLSIRLGAASIERSALRTPHRAAGPRLGPVDHRPMLVEWMRHDAITLDLAQRIRISCGLDGDRQEERHQRINGEVE